MRVSTGYSASNSLYDVSAATERLAAAQQRMSSGRQLEKPSDDPRGTAIALGLQSTLDAIDQYQRNITDAKGFLGTADSALSQAATAVRQARTLAVQASSSAIDPTERAGFVTQLDSIVKQLGAMGNSMYGHRYVFGGQRTTQRPFQATGDTIVYKGGSSSTGDADLSVEIAPGEAMVINTPGDQALGSALTALGDLRAHLQSGTPSDISNNDLDKLDGALNDITGARAEIGGRSQRLQQAGDRLDQTTVELTAFRSKIVDADIPQTVVELQSAQTTYQAALAATARGFQQSLLDFLK